MITRRFVDMLITHLVGERFKEKPADATFKSHEFLVRGGYIRQLGSGIYSFLPLGHKIMQKIGNIIREEMNAIGGQECLFPYAMPKEVWEESGRYHTIGEELVRFKDRKDSGMLLGMTHEEPVVHGVRSENDNYKRYPFMVYQIQSKFRDEMRPRAGLLRVREFTMKDAYSFHTSQECLEKHYEEQRQAYVNVYNRCGIKKLVMVEADGGVMGDSVSHEFMSVNDAGEDTLSICPGCKKGYNKEVLEIKKMDMERCACGSFYEEKRGVEIGNIFQLGTKYSKSMSMTYLDENGNRQIPVMGCYGIGLGRILACVVEESADQFGPIWPLSIAPYAVHICLISAKADIKKAADKLYAGLKKKDVDVIYDNRAVSAGFAFGDADLIGAPVRVIFGEKAFASGECELVTRDKKIKKVVKVSDIQKETLALLQVLK